MLVRRILSDRLARYYAQPAHAVVGSYHYDEADQEQHHPQHSVSLPFSKLWGEWHWKFLYQRLYDQQKGQWLTPVELFRPYYSNAIGNFVFQTHERKVKKQMLMNNDTVSLEILEVGGGRGTNAHLILDYFHSHYPDLYESCLYTLVDSSPSLHQLQKLVFEQSVHRDKVVVKLLDLMEVAEGKQDLFDSPLSPSSRQCHTAVLALEVLDNLPHDKIRKQKLRGETVLEQAELEAFPEDQSLREAFHPLTDPLLERILDVAPWYASSSRPQVSWVPSVACGALLHLAKTRPDCTILLADFDWLPPPDRFHPSVEKISTLLSLYIPGDGEPLVTSMDGYDYHHYLSMSPEECCDILFPTNFHKLAAFCRAIFPSPDSLSSSYPDTIVSVVPQSTFLRQYGGQEVLDTQSWLTGYSPLLEDFSNCSILTVRR